MTFWELPARTEEKANKAKAKIKCAVCDNEILEIEPGQSICEVCWMRALDEDIDLDDN